MSHSWHRFDPMLAFYKRTEEMNVSTRRWVVIRKQRLLLGRMSNRDNDRWTPVAIWRQLHWYLNRMIDYLLLREQRKEKVAYRWKISETRFFLFRKEKKNSGDTCLSKRITSPCDLTFKRCYGSYSFIPSRQDSERSCDFSPRWHTTCCSVCETPVHVDARYRR